MIKFIGTNCVNLTLCAFEAAAAKNNKPTYNYQNNNDNEF